MKSADIIEKVRAFATTAHHGQVRKYADEPYIRHPERVMSTCEKYTNDTSMLCAALLHDVLEDTTITEKEMFSFLESISDTQSANRTMSLVVDLTDVFVKKDYPQWNRRKRKAMELERLEKTSPDSQTIKYADILDNTNDIVDGDNGFAPLFLRECRALLKKLDKGNAELHALAIKAVDDGLAKLRH
jgi:(p)ppGpp synthase/HD superfamily hydrolase